MIRVLVLLLSLFHLNRISASDPDEFRTIEQIVQSHGFDIEHHQVKTDDGYHLTLHRLVSHQNISLGLPQVQEGGFYQYQIERKPVIVQHGLFGSSADFIINSPFLYSNRSRCGDNLAFALHLTDRYDVWLGNSRGNRYSRGHEKLSVRDRAYWRFSFDQMATLDTPAIVNYVRNVTRKQSIAWVGYSQGTAMMFALLSLQPDFAQYIHPFIALAPVTSVASIRSPIRYVAPLGPLIRLEGGEFLPSDRLVNKLSELLCANHIEEEYLCDNLVFLFSGYDPKHLNLTRIPVYFQFLPSSVSSWDIAHWSQLVQSKRFARFDYGSAGENRAAYGQPTVPDYPLERIPKDARIVLMRGRNDLLSSIPDAERLMRILTKSGVRFTDYVVPDPNWTHVDFALGIDAGKLVYDKVVEMLDKYTD